MIDLPPQEEALAEDIIGNEIISHLRQEALDYIFQVGDSKSWVNEWSKDRVAEMDLYEILGVLGYDSISEYIEDNK